MIKLGVCSLTLGTYSVQEIINAVKKTDLIAIEWWGKDHVPCGNLEIAQQVGTLTREADLEVSSYGSYYKVGLSENDGMKFADVLATAKALQAPTIRVWAGTCNYEDATKEQIKEIIDDTIRIANMAKKEDISITFESHRNTLTNTNESAKLFADQVIHDNIFFSWQKVIGSSVDYACEGIKATLPRLSTVHLYHWLVTNSNEMKINKRPFCEGKEDWEKYFELLKSSSKDHYVLMEFTCDNSLEQFFADAKAMHDLIN